MHWVAPFYTTGGSDNYNHDVIFIKKIPTHPRERLKRKTARLRCWLLFFKMDLAKYEIYVKNDEKLKSLLERNHGKRNYYICKRISELATNSSVASYENWFGVEIDAEQNY